MKKLLLLSAAALLSVGAMAQNRSTQTATPSHDQTFKANGRVSNLNESRVTGSYWVNYSDEIEYYIQGGGAGFPNPAVRSSSLLPIFPDTTIILGYDAAGVPFGNWIHAAGTMVDPTRLPSGWIAPGTNYSIDSMQMVYAYVRRTDNTIVDTLTLTYIESDNTLLYTIDPTGEAWEYQDILWDTVANAPAASGVLATYRFPLTEADSTMYNPTDGFNLKVFSDDHQFTNLTNKRIGVVVTFQPGYLWTEFENANPNADSLLGKNSFWLLSYEENGDNTAPNNYGNQWSYNMSYVIDSRSLYTQWTNGWNGFFLPTPYWTAGWPWEAHAIYFKATSDQVGINEVNNFAGLSAYPNPVNDNLTVAIDLKEATDNLTVSLTDVLGREVVAVNEGHQASGKHVVKIDMSNLANGLYNCTVKSGSQAATSQVVINR